jgi:hypothetical protein
MQGAGKQGFEPRLVTPAVLIGAFDRAQATLGWEPADPI